MTTAFTSSTLMTRGRTVALAVTLALTSMFPAAGAVFADGGELVTPTPAVTATQPFDIDPNGGLTGLTARVVAGEAGVDFRADPSHSGQVISMLANGTIVDLRVDRADTVYDADGVTRWWPVTVNGQDGWISGLFLEQPDAPVASASRSTSRVPYDYDGTLTAEISADGDGLILRADPDASSAEVATLPDGTIVNLRISDLDTVYDAAGTRWWPVEVDGQVGWVSGDYLISPGTEPVFVDDADDMVSPNVTPGASRPSGAPTSTATQTPAASTGEFAVGDWAVIEIEARDIELRLGPSTDSASAGAAPDMALVEILEVDASGWYKVRWDRITGYVDGSVLIPGEAPQRASRSGTEVAETPAPVAESDDDAAFAARNTAFIDSVSGAGVNVRENPGTDTESVGFLAEGTEVTITDGPDAASSGEDWYRMTDGNVSGWVRADLLADTEPAQASAPDTTDDAVDAADDTANAVADPETGFILPLASFNFTQDFGCSSLGFYSYDPAWGCSVHDGVDLAAPSGTALRAVDSGTVVAAGWCDCGLGYYVEIDHGSGLHSVYGHMASQPYVSVGQTVSQGETIGPVGSTGLSTGPHVHFMVRLNGESQDPKNYLPPLN